MKKLFISALAAIVLCSCAKEDAPVILPEHEGIPVNILFAGAGSSYDTRAVFDDTAEAEPWEKKINTLTLCAYNANGDLVMFKEVSQREIDNMVGELYLPQTVAGTECSIMAAANIEIDRTKIKSLTYLRDAVQNDEGACYNGTIEEVTTGKKPNEGFAMSGTTTIKVNADGTTNNAVITLKRIVAKIAVQLDMADDFPDRYNGAQVMAHAIYINNICSASHVFSVSNPENFRRNNSWLQYGSISGCKSLNLFYAFEQPAQKPGEESYLEVYLSFDADGNWDTIYDRIVKTVSIPIMGSGNGKIQRNAYYRLHGIIRDFDALELKTSIQVAEWETPETQDLGEIAVN